ncbi:MAG TPA: TIM barrel protein, partial [Armatimonadota bacterium]|nr:TIM barrel protein [Armatimonadota bacterium]
SLAFLFDGGSVCFGVELVSGMSRIGIAVWNFEGTELSPKLRIFAEMGYTAASINGRLLDSLSVEDEAEADTILDECDLLLTVHGGLRDSEGVAAIRRAERIIRWHQRTGRIVCSSYDVPRVTIAEGVRRVAPEPILGIFEEVVSAFAGTGIRVLLEDCPTDPEHISRLEGWSGKYPHLGILVDLGHMNLRLREPSHDPQALKPGAVEAYLKGIPWEIVELHVHSNDGSRDQHAPPYAPNADLRTAARVLREIGFKGISTIELVPCWCRMPTEEIIPACRKSLEYWSDLL